MPNQQVEQVYAAQQKSLEIAKHLAKYSTPVGAQDSDRAKYLLACLGEECGETQQMVGKSLRFGLDNSHQKYGALTNIDNIIKEVHDIVAVYFMLLEELDQLPEINETLVKVKRRRVERNL